ncbi:sensor histidine kinase [Vibrio coralliilyticus]|uniref:sensor histidine kinase n=1 Tax=Vibrio coralliilyticus TaxID=190893 RepID=UPI00155FA406|nr:HAMP domain-containing sensor histidine kinase [Vibrio coralliilyticus]NRF14575.1 HAMP domain-containing histidine kinase [Vibrio coralliilyticus]
MKFKISSLKHSMIAMLFATALILVTLMSTLWLLHFFNSHDNMIKGALLEVAHKSESESVEQSPRFIKTSKWHQLPIEIRRHFDRDLLSPNQIHHKSDRTSPLSRPTESVYVMLITKPDGKVHYVAHHFKEPPNAPPQNWFETPEIQAILFGAFALSFFLMMLFTFMYSATKPIQHLYRWARQLDSANISSAPPNFQYEELNTLAQIILDSLRKTEASLKREQEFVRYASHELRTPIAVILSSVELMDKVEKQWEEKSHNAKQRIKDASLCMAELCDTLLWLDKAEHSQLTTQSVALSSVLHSEIENLSYLTQAKNIEIQIHTDSYKANLPYAAIQMIAANLLRNAVQHTHEGVITIIQQQGSIQIINKEYSDYYEHYPDKSGFGLGLMLVRRLCRQLRWGFRFEKTHGQCRASLSIGEPNLMLTKGLDDVLCEQSAL